MSELERLRKEYDAAVKRRHGKIGATGLEIRADALRAALEAEAERLRQERDKWKRRYDIATMPTSPTPRPTEGGECD